MNNESQHQQFLRVKSTWLAFLRADSTTTQIAFTASVNLVMMLLGVTTGVLLARHLGPSGRGELAAIQLWPAFLAAIAMFGMPEALGYYSASDATKRGRYLSTATLMALLSSLFFMVGGFFAMPFLLSVQNAETVQVSRLYLLLLPVMAIEGIPPHSMRGSGRLREWNLLRLLPGLGWLMVIGVSVVASRTTPRFLIVGYLAVLAILCLPVNIFVYRRTVRPHKVEPKLGRRLARFGLPSMLSSVPQLFNLRLDQMIMASLMPSHMLGLYVVAVAWSGGLTPLMTSLGFVLFPKIASQPDPTIQANILAQATRLCVVLGVSLCILAIPITPFAVPLLFGHEYDASIPSSAILLVGAAMVGLNYLMEEGLRGLGQPSSVLWAEIGGLAISALALLILLPRLGIMGAALASITGYGSITLLLLAQLRKHTGVSVQRFLCPTRLEFELVQLKAKLALMRLVPGHSR